MGDLTPEEEEELQQLRALDAQDKVRSEGEEAVQRHREATKPAPKPAAKRPFSFYRVTVGALRDVSQDLLDVSRDAAAAVRRNATDATSVLSRIPIIGSVLQAGGAAMLATGVEPESPQLPKLKGEEDAGVVERVSRSILGFMIPYAGAAKAVGVARGASWLGRAGKAMLAGGIVDFTKDPTTNNLANVVRDTFGIDNDVLDALASEEDDDALYSRFKAAIVNAPVGLAADALMETGFRAVRAYRDWKGTLADANDAVQAARADMGLDAKARDLVVIGDEVAEPARSGLVRKAEKVSAGGARANAPEEASRAFNPETDIGPQNAPTTFEDVLEHLKRASGLDVDPALLSRLAKNLLDGNPENALAKLGIDPAKLDFSLYDDPSLLGRLQKGLAEVYETIANRLGRSGETVSEASINAGARALATTADVLRDLHGNTSNLAETLMGARLFVGAHAHKLLSVADEAAAAIKAGGPDAKDKWVAFMEAFHRHAYYLGTLRGAGSEVGRALRSLQMVARVGKKNATRGLKEAIEKEGAEQRFSFEEGASHYLAELLTDSDKLLALEKLRRLDGDVGDLTRHVRARNMSGLNRLDAALRETVGNLFSPATAIWNISSGGAMLGLRALEKGFLAIGKMALSPLGKRFSQEARIQMMEAWAYTDGILSGFRAAYGNTMALLEREGMADVAINLDTMGLKKLATQAAARAVEGSKRVASNFERADVVNERWFAMRPSERKALKDTINSMSLPALLQQGLRGLVDASAAAVNAVGTMSRAGTILFINAPDQLMGTLAARAGAQAYAVRHAASEAAELGLEGKELSEFLKARAIQMTGEVDGWHPEGFDAGFREAGHNAGEVEAREILFQDDLELSFNRGLTHAMGATPFVHMLVPFVKTPLRILERTAIDYTPLGLLKDRMRSAIMAGGQQRQEALTRLALGMTATMTALQLADDRTIVGSDGSYSSTARLSRPSYSLRIGDDNVEFLRVDPLGTILGWAVDVKAFMDQNETDPQAPQGFEEMFEAMVWASAANVLSKSWLTSLRNITELAGLNNPEDLATRGRRFANSFAARIVPASGIQRMATKAGDFVPEASTFMEALIGASIGADTLPTKRDYLIGRPMPVEGLNRIVGVRVAPQAGDDDPLLKELEDLSFDLPGAKRTVEGVHLNASQFSRWLELKGQVVISPDTGMNLEDTLTALIKLPEYQEMNRSARVQAMRDEMEGFSRMATDQLIREDKQFAHDVLQKETWDVLELRGASKATKDATTAKLARDLGLQ